MDRLDAMGVLLAAVDNGSFTAASRKLGMPLATVSRKIGELEAHLGTRLLMRSTRSLALTDAGIAYVAACRRILEHIADAETTASGEYQTPRGDLVVTAPLSFGRLHVLPVVTDFLARFPEIKVRLMLSDRNLSLVEDHVDMAVRVGRLPDSRLIATRVGAIRRVVCGSPDYFAAHGVPKTPADLPHHSCVTFAGMPEGAPWTFPSRSRTETKEPRCRLNVDTAEAAVDAAISGIGLAHVLSYQVARAVTEGRLRIVLQHHEGAPIPVSLIHAAQGLLPLKTRGFLDFASPRLRTALEEVESSAVLEARRGY